MIRRMLEVSLPSMLSLLFRVLESCRWRKNSSNSLTSSLSDRSVIFLMVCPVLLARKDAEELELLWGKRVELLEGREKLFPR